MRAYKNRNFQILGRLDRNLHLTKLFQVDILPIYDPLSFANPNYEPVFNPWLQANHYEQQYVFSRDEVKVGFLLVNC